jgi:hypothetical protein
MLKKGIPILIILLVIVGVLYIKSTQKSESEHVIKEKVIASPIETPGLEKNSKAVSEGFKRFTMDKEYFLCDIPVSWEFLKTDERKAKKGVYGVELLGPRMNNAPTIAYVTFYLNGNIYFSDFNNFIERNSKDIFGDTKTETDTYGPVEKIKLNGKFAYRLEREVQTNIDPESKAGKFIMIKEKLYVIPSDKGFHVLHFMVSSSAYSKYLPVFEEMVYSFRGV